jgi:hypothetical protein
MAMHTAEESIKQHFPGDTIIPAGPPPQLLKDLDKSLANAGFFFNPNQVRVKDFDFHFFVVESFFPSGRIRTSQCLIVHKATGNRMFSDVTKWPIMDFWVLRAELNHLVHESFEDKGDE